jgi:hypothetical protein
MDGDAVSEPPPVASGWSEARHPGGRVSVWRPRFAQCRENPEVWIRFGPFDSRRKAEWGRTQCINGEDDWYKFEVVTRSSVGGDGLMTYSTYVRYLPDAPFRERMEPVPREETRARKKRANKDINFLRGVRRERRIVRQKEAAARQREDEYKRNLPGGAIDSGDL